MRDSADLPHVEFRVLMAMASFADFQDGTRSRPSNGRVSKLTGIARHNVNRAVRNLVAKGRLVVVKRGGPRDVVEYRVPIEGDPGYRQHVSPRDTPLSHHETCLVSPRDTNTSLNTSSSTPHALVARTLELERARVAELDIANYSEKINRAFAGVSKIT